MGVVHITDSVFTNKQTRDGIHVYTIVSKISWKYLFVLLETKKECNQLYSQ